MYIKYSTRKFKSVHLFRIKNLKELYKLRGIDRTQEEILTDVVEEGLKIVEREVSAASIVSPHIGGVRDFLLKADEFKRRVAPRGIKDEE